MGPLPNCMVCTHFDRENERGLSCKAFPSGIPEMVIDGVNTHMKPIEGDSGLQFELDTERAKEFGVIVDAEGLVQPDGD